MDGTPTLRMNEYILATVTLGRADLGPERTSQTGKDLPQPEELVFEVQCPTPVSIWMVGGSFQDNSPTSSPSAGTHTSLASSTTTQSTQRIGQSDGPILAPLALLYGSRGPPLQRTSTDSNVGNGDLSKHGNEKPSSLSTWEKMVPSFLRTNSGRRSLK
jgi:hypothetical protein